MLVRIKFTGSDANKITKDEHKELEDFLGESIRVSQMKIDSDGNFSSVSWRETFSKERVEEDPDYKLVTPADMYHIIDDNNYIVDLEKFTLKYPHFEFTIKGMPKVANSGHLDLIEEMNRISSKIEEAKNKFDKVVEFNQRCDVHVPNLGLLNINKLAYATDYCTEALQELLYQGWRIIAVCPQPNQRRPDYILGMSVTGLEDEVNVEHFAGDGREGYLKEKDKNNL